MDPRCLGEKFAAKYPNTDIERKSVYSLSFRKTLESKLREFQFKILNCIVFINEKVFRFGMADSPTCAYCHLLFSSKVSSDFSGNIVLSWLRNYDSLC